MQQETQVEMDLHHRCLSLFLWMVGLAIHLSSDRDWFNRLYSRPFDRGLAEVQAIQLDNLPFGEYRFSCDL
jgi:hypothetical protein